MPFVNFSMAQFCSAGCSSLKKMPRYLTVGAPCEQPLESTKISEFGVVGTSAHLYKNEISANENDYEGRTRSPVPGGDAHLLREVVQGVDGAAFV